MPKEHVIVGYIPVVHKGYIKFFESQPKAKQCFVFTQETLDLVDYIRKDVRALLPPQQVTVIKGLGYFDTVAELTAKHIKDIDQPSITVHMPYEDVSRSFAEKYIKKATVEFYPIFLRWDRESVDMNTTDENESKISEKEFDKNIIMQALVEAGHSPDIWRRVGAIVTQDDKIVAKAHNQSEPSQHSSSMEGDPRNAFSRGVAIEMSLFTHAEAKLIAQAAKEGRSLEGASLYVTTFPCPACAKLIAHSGIATCYYKDGYAVLDGRSVLEANNVEIIRVESHDKQEKGPEFIPYIKK